VTIERRFDLGVEHQARKTFASLAQSAIEAGELLMTSAFRPGRLADTVLGAEHPSPGLSEQEVAIVDAEVDEQVLQFL
jgi:hypothetical protein